jgi:hypothetical protein
MSSYARTIPDITREKGKLSVYRRQVSNEDK